MKTKMLNLFLFFLLLGSNLVSAEVFSEKIDIPEASGIVSLPNGDFLVVDDDQGIFLLSRDLKEKLILGRDECNFLEDLEGITISTDRKSLYILSEVGGRVFRLPLQKTGSDFKIGKPEPLGSLLTLSERSNKGYEGICVISLNGQDHLLAVHQKDPVALAIFSLPELKRLTICRLPPELEQLLANLSDVTVDQRNGHILLLSAKSCRIVELRAKIRSSIEELEIVSNTKLRGQLSGKPEGICFDSMERLVIVTDGGGDPGNFIRFDR